MILPVVTAHTKSSFSATSMYKTHCWEGFCYHRLPACLILLPAFIHSISLCLSYIWGFPGGPSPFSLTLIPASAGNALLAITKA